MMPTIRVIRVDYADESRYHTDFQHFKDFNTEDFMSHRNYDFHIRALDAESEAAFGCLDIIAASGNPYVGVQLYLGKQGGAHHVRLAGQRQVHIHFQMGLHGRPHRSS